MVAAHDHHVPEHDSGVALIRDRLEHGVDGRLGFHGADVVVHGALRRQHVLHLGVDLVVLVLGAVTHVHDSGLAVVIVLDDVDHDVRHAVEVLVGGEQGFGDHDLLEGVGVTRQAFHQLVILEAVHKVGGLHDQDLNAVFDGTLKGFFHIVDVDAVAPLHVVDDDLGSERTPYREIFHSFVDSRLDAAYGQAAAVVKAGAEGYDQKFLFADLVLVAHQVQGGIAGLVVLFILFLGPRAAKQQHERQKDRQQFFHVFSSSYYSIAVLPRRTQYSCYAAGRSQAAPCSLPRLWMRPVRLRRKA